MKRIDAATFRAMVLNAATALESQKQHINELNVFPVPDGDTGTNMSLTMGAAGAEMRKGQPATLGKAAEATASALLRGARGNSGVILSLLFRGLSRTLRDKTDADAVLFAAAMEEGVSAAYKAVMKPAEGTILTVSRLASARASEAAAEGMDCRATLGEALIAAKKALAETIHQNPVLKKAGVVDAGGEGYVVILSAMIAAMDGEVIEVTAAGDEPKEKANFSDFETGDITFGYCTEFIVTRTNTKDPGLLQRFLGGLGDSIVVVDDDEIIKVHVHTNDPGVVLTEALTYGSLLTVKIENMREQHTETIARESLAEEESIAEPEKAFGVVTVCAGAGVEAVFRDLGADGTIAGGQTMNPATEDILRAINKVPAETVFVLPNNKNIIMAAEQCRDLTEKNVVVIPSKTVPQGIAALLDFDPGLDAVALTQAMCAALERVHTVSVTYAARDSEFDGYAIREGEYLTLLEGKLLGTDRDMDAVGDRIAACLGDFDPEYLTVFYGADVAEDAAEAMAAKLGVGLADADVTVVNGGQPVYYYIISAE